MLVNTGRAYLRGRIEANTALFSGTLYMALSTDATAPAATDIAISGEITANGLQRVAVTAAHTQGQNTWVFANTFTYNGNAAVNVQKVALWDAAVNGNLITEDVIASTTFQQAGDNAPIVVQFSL